MQKRGENLRKTIRKCGNKESALDECNQALQYARALFKSLIDYIKQVIQRPSETL